MLADLLEAAGVLDAVFVGLDEEVLDDDVGTVVLLDAAGTEVARFEYPPA